MISIFGLRTPKLVLVFENPKLYFRFWYISDQQYSMETMKEGISCNLRSRNSFGCLGRRVYIHLNALERVLVLVKNNVEQQTNRRSFCINETIRDMIHACNTDENKGKDDSSFEDQDELSLSKFDFHDFIFDDGKGLLSIPVLTHIRSENCRKCLRRIKGAKRDAPKMLCAERNIL